MNKETMPNFLSRRAFLTPNRTAIYFQDQQLTFQELYNRSYHIAGQLQRFGLRPNQFAGVLLTNHIDTVVILCALQLLRVRAVILNNRLTATELIYQLKDSKADLFLHEFADKESTIRLELPELKTISKEQLIISEKEEPYIQEEISLDDICTVMYTSGTTGNPKGVIQTYGNHWWNAVGSALNLGLTEMDAWLCAVPIFHISGYSILMKSLIYGMPIVLHDSFDAQKVLKDIEEKQVTIMSVVGTMLTRIVDQLKSPLPSYFRCFLLGGGPAPLPLLETCVKKGAPVFQTYGMTETASQIVTLAPEDSLTKLGSAGKPLFPSQIKIVNETGSQACPKEPGEIVVKGPNVTKGYLNKPEATEKNIRDGWFNTGDIGYLDDEGFLFVLDRRSDLIISGGENIYPAEIEEVLLAHPDIVDAGVTGLEDATWGHVPIAFIVKKEGSRVTEEELLMFCHERLAKYKVPKAIRCLDQLPRNAAKKLLRRKLLDELS